MPADSRQAAQKRVDRIAWFKAELNELEREGGLTLTTQQRAVLDAHLHALVSSLHAQYGVDATESARRVSWGMRIASLIGAAALLAAGILFLHRVWGSLAAPLQLLLLTIAPIALLVGAELAFRLGVDRFYVSVLALVAAVSFIVEVNGLGAMLNLADSPQVLLVWGGFTTCLACAYGFRLLLAAGLILLSAWTAALALHMQGYYWGAFVQRTQLLLPSAFLLYSLPWLTRSRGPQGFSLIYRLCGAGVGLLALLLLSTAGDRCVADFSPNHVAAAYQLAGIILSLGVVAHGLRGAESPLVNLGALAFVVFVFTRLHSWWWDWMPKYLFFLTLGLIAFGLLLVFRRVRSRLSPGGAI